MLDKSEVSAKVEKKMAPVVCYLIIIILITQSEGGVVITLSLINVLQVLKELEPTSIVQITYLLDRSNGSTYQLTCV